MTDPGDGRTDPGDGRSELGGEPADPRGGAPGDGRTGPGQGGGGPGQGGAGPGQGGAGLGRYQDPVTIQRVLHTARTVAIVGLSGNELRASYFVGYYLIRHGYRVIPVNPRESEILGQRSYGSLPEVPGPVDVVNVFRAPDALPGIARGAVAIQAGVLWCQFGVINFEAARIAEDGGVAVIMDRCLKVEHARYLGRMHWLGFNTQRITSVRTGLQ